MQSDNHNQLIAQPHTDNHGASLEKNSRIEWVDFAKGLAMLLVIVAHTMVGEFSGSVVRGIIYSFHMPLFFMLSGLTMRYSENFLQFVKRIGKSARSLLIPAVLLYFAWITIEVIRGLGSFFDFAYIKGKALTLLFASASSTMWGETFIAGIGMIWFFFVLFFGKAIFDFIHLVVSRITKGKYKNLWICIIVLLATAIGVLLGYYRWLPFSIDVALAILPFFAAGQFVKRIQFQNKTVMAFIICIVLWAASFYITYHRWDDWTYMEVGLRRYSLIPFSYIAAIAGTLVVGLSGILLEKFKVCKVVNFIGQKSIYLLCIHIMDQLWDFIWYTEGRQFFSAAKRLGCDLIVFVAIMLLLKCVHMVQTKFAN